VADDPKPEQKPGEPSGNPAPTSASISPAPTVAAGEPDKNPGSPATPPPPAASNMQAEPLSDGTVPTVLTPGDGHKSVAKGKTGISSIYRKADVLTTLITFVAAAIACGLIIAGYAYFTRNTSKVAPPPKLTTLSPSDVSKLNDFFNGNTAGSAAQVLTVSSPSLFNGRVGIASDLKVTGAVSVVGPTSLGTLTVDQNTTLGVTDIRGSLVVAGPVNLQSPTTLGGGGTVTGNFTVSGNGSYGGTISAGTINVASLSVTTINLAGHLNISGQNPSASPASSDATSAQVSGNDSAGTVTVSVGSVTPNANQCPDENLATVTFHSSYPVLPVILITPVGALSAKIQPFVIPGASSFTIGAACFTSSSGHANYSFNYWVIQ
jgi:hypothetical protein